MSRFLLSFAIVLVSMGLAASAEARTRVSVFVGSGGYYDPYWGPYPHYRHHHRHFHSGFVYAPAPMIVEPVPVVIASPPVTYVAPPAEPAAIPANQTSPTFTDESGRTCRAYETTRVFDGEAQMVGGKACIYPDGAWRVVE